ncbi:MAG: NADH-quinone oxidoreductase subunit NuoK [Proteobacteria bacterium]|nr:NADH-quinone oxidoreductase subunit NuoK [Pseudomonadota bacterium]
MIPIEQLLALAFVLLGIGACGVLVRRNLLVVLMSIELMLNATNLAFVSIARALGDTAGHVMVLMIFVVAAVEVAVGMAIVVNMFRQRDSISVDSFGTMKG